MVPDATSRLACLLPQPRRITVLEGVCRATTIEMAREASIPEQGYVLRIESGIKLAFNDPAGQFYGQQTLRQLRALFGDILPRLRVEDWPDYPARGVMLDISRDKVPTMQTLRLIVDELAHLKINQLQLYTEHTFAYREHRTVWQEASPMTGEEIRELDAYCRERFIELVPNQNSLGHLERWLKHDRYLPLAESPEGSDFPTGERCEYPVSICPTDPRSIELVGELYDELLPNFTSRLFNVGCDETFDIGQPGTRSEAICRERGVRRVYLDFLKQIHALCARHDRRMMFWGDIIVQSPELVAELPKDVIALEWGYEADHPWDEHLRHFVAAERDFYVCPGTSSWLSLAGRTTNMLDNLRRAAESGVRHGAKGFLNTDWGDKGHHQYWPVSYLPIAYGAAVSWCVQSSHDLDLCPAVDAHLFRDQNGQAARFFYELGNVYTLGKSIKNSTVLGRLLHEPPNRPSHALAEVTIEQLRLQETTIGGLVSRVERFCLDRPDAALIADEARDTADLLCYASHLGRMRIGDTSVAVAQLQSELETMLPTRSRLWLSRNRPGGLADSLKRLQSTVPNT